MTRTTKTPSRRRNHVRLGVECLETRDCMSAVLDNNGVLTITGNSSPNTVVVTQDDDENTLIVVENNGPAQEFDSSDVDGIQVDLQGGADRFTFQLGDADFERAKVIGVTMGGGDDSITFRLDRQSDGDNAEIRANLEIILAGDAGKDTMTAKVGKIDHAIFSLEFFGGAANDKGTAKFFGDLEGANATVIMNDGAGNDSLSVIAGIDIDDESAMRIVLGGADGFDTLVASFAGELDGLLEVQSNGGNHRDNVIANLITEDDSNGQLDAIIRGGANAVIPGQPPLLDLVVLNFVVDSDEVAVLNLLQLQD